MYKRNKIKCNKFTLGGVKSGDKGYPLTAGELNATDNRWASIGTATTPASGSCAIVLTFKDAAGTTMATPVAGRLYVSEVATGLTVDAVDTSLVIDTSGVLTLVDTGVLKYYNYVTTAAGLLGLTLTAATDSYWLCLQSPNGGLIISDECVVNA
jgi:hypothetical protein